MQHDLILKGARVIDPSQNHDGLCDVAFAEGRVSGFGRDLEYYSGMVFQIETGGDGTSPVAGGGRYDGLLTSLGAESQVPAVGAAIHTERLLAATEGAR